MDNQYITYGRNKYLRIPLDEDCQNSFEISMLHATSPKCLLPIQLVHERDGTYLDYCVTGLVSLEESQGDDEIDTYFQSIIFALERLGKVLDSYLLTEKQIDLSPSRIFLRKEMGEFLFCYSLSQKKTIQESLTELMEFFLKKLNPLEEREVILTYGVYQKAREPHVTLKSLADYYRGKGEDLLTEAGNHQVQKRNDTFNEKKREQSTAFLNQVETRLKNGGIAKSEQGAEVRLDQETKKMADPLYRSYGIERPHEMNAFETWKSERETQNFERGVYENSEPLFGELEWNQSQFDYSKTGLQIEKDSLERVENSTEFSKEKNLESDFEENNQKEKPWQLFIKSHAFEIGVAGSVVAGMIIVLLT